MRNRKKSPHFKKVRQNTDQSLDSERKKTDESLSAARDKLQQESDQLVEKARNKTDQIMGGVRTDIDIDKAMDKERSDVDAVIITERQSEDILAIDTLELERKRTDGRLTLERNKTDKETETASILLSEVESRVVKRTSELKEAKLIAESANQTKSKFLANMSHEIRTPLAAIIGFSELLISPEIGPEEKTNFVGAIKRNGELLATLINDILDLSKVEFGKLKIERSNVAISEVITDLTTLLGQKALEKQIALSFIRDSAVPEFVCTDPLRLKQILINVIGNAIKFTEKGSVNVKISYVAAAKGSGNLIFEIHDTGPGIDSQEVSQLFKTFSTDTTKKRKEAGAGLGLALSKNLANLLGGDVVLTESTPQKGSTFTVTVHSPQMDHAAAEEKAKADALPAKNIGRRLDGLKALVVDDSIDNQFLVSWILNQAGAEIDTAENGQIAIDKIHRGNYDVVLMDLQMPVKDGYETTTELRKEGYKRPIIALTAYARKEEREYCLTHGFNDHVSKPINRETLLTSISATTGH